MKKDYFQSIRTQLVLFIFLVMMSSSILTGLLVIFSLQFQMGVDEYGEMGLRFPFQIITWTFLIISTVIGTMLSFGFSSHFLQPVHTLIKAMKEIRNGNYDVRVKGGPPEREIGRLISNFNDMAAELQGVEMLKSDFINYFSHEFKTPIVSIKGFARQLQQKGLSEEKRVEYAEIIVRESQRLVKLSSNTLVLTRLEHQKIITDKKDFELDEQLRHAILLLQNEWEEKDLELDLDLEQVTIHTNEEMLSQVWINLISNAIRYSQPKGKLWISSKNRGSEIKVRIQDEGSGMDDETTGRIFEKFYQGDASRGGDGNGLGLSIVKRIIELCNGRIAVKSQLGKGSTFIIYLPKKGT